MSYRAPLAIEGLLILLSGLVLFDATHTTRLSAAGIGAAGVLIAIVAAIGLVRRSWARIFVFGCAVLATFLAFAALTPSGPDEYPVIAYFGLTALILLVAALAAVTTIVERE